MTKKILTSCIMILAVILIISCRKKETATTEEFSIPVDYFNLDNGLKVVLSRDTTTPVVTVAVYYNIGFRIEPKDRTGFAHLFEHMMFQASGNLPKGSFDTLITNNGGINNGSTRFDFTNYYEVVPSNILEPVLWAEADRMSGLAITQENLSNQQGVVVNEINGALHNQPYGGFPWLDMPQYANTNWYNAHNFYGDINDVKSAKTDEVQNFFNTYYAPNNAVVVVRGDFKTGEAKEWIRKYFGGIPSAQQPDKPDLAEPGQTEEKVVSKADSLATRPALAFSYHMAERNAPEYYAMGLLDQILLQGENSLLYTALVKKKGFTGSVDGGINLLGNMFDYNGPMLWTGYLFHDNNVPADTIMNVVDSVINEVIRKPVDGKTIERAIIKFRSGFYDELNSTFGQGTANLLACFALFDDDPGRINTLEDNFRKVTSDLLKQTAEKFLRRENRTVLKIVPKAGK
jgi:predicted Zn-dependent peptidase